VGPSKPGYIVLTVAATKGLAFASERYLVAINSHKQANGGALSELQGETVDLRRWTCAKDLNVLLYVGIERLQERAIKKNKKNLLNSTDGVGKTGKRKKGPALLFGKNGIYIPRKVKKSRIDLLFGAQPHCKAAQKAAFHLNRGRAGNLDIETLLGPEKQATSISYTGENLQGGLYNLEKDSRNKPGNLYLKIWGIANYVCRLQEV